MNIKSTFFVFLVFLLSVAIVSCNGDEKATKKEVKKTPVQAIDTTSIDKDTTNNAVVEENTTAEQEDTEQYSGTFTSDPKKYFLIANSFEIKANAEKFLKDLEAKSFDACIIPTDFGMYLVSYQGFSDRKEAFRTLQKEIDAGKQVWLHIVPED